MVYDGDGNEDFVGMILPDKRKGTFGIVCSSVCYA
jgi:hypothetical protein